MFRSMFLNQFICLSLLLLACSCKDNPSPASPKDEGQLRGAFIPEEDLAEFIVDQNTDMETAFKEGKMEELSAFYADNCLLLGTNDYQIEGIEAIQDYWTRITSPVDWKLAVNAISRDENEIYKTAAYQQLKNKPTDWKDAMGDRFKGRDIVYQLGHSTLKYNKADGQLNTSDVDFILLWVQQPNGAYKIGVDSYVRN